MESTEIFLNRKIIVGTVAYTYYGFEYCRLHVNKTKRQRHMYQIPLKFGIWANWGIDINICDFEYVTLN